MRYWAPKIALKFVPKLTLMHTPMLALMLTLMLILMLFLLMAWAPVAAQSATRSLAARPDPVALAASSFYHVHVEGSAAAANPDPERWGKGFSIGPNQLITSRHVVGEHRDWMPSNQTRTNPPRRLRQEEARALNPIDRRVSLYRSLDLDENNLGNFILPPPSGQLDVVGIVVPELNNDSYYQLSFCGIHEDGEYRALISTSAAPTDKTSVRQNQIELLPLTTIGYKPLEYDGLYVFELDQLISGNNGWGHSGSPIFDAENYVVALVSAVVVEQGKQFILGTPIHPRMPGATNVLSLEPGGKRQRNSSKCSLSNTVSKIRNQVAGHANWELKVKRDQEGFPLSEMLLSYESISENPNISSVTLEYYFYGKRDRTRSINRITYPDRELNEVVIKKNEPVVDRLFATGKIIEKGKDLVEPFLKGLDGGGYIEYVEVIITPEYAGSLPGTPPRKSITREFAWKTR